MRDLTRILFFTLVCYHLLAAANPSVIVVGAGAAGVAAAARLLQHGTHITVLEAEGRLGGRIHSVHLGDALVDVGAEYVHGVDGNVAHELGARYLRPIADDFRVTLFYSNGSRLEEAFAQDLQTSVLDVLGYGAYEPGFNVTGWSLADYFRLRYESTFLQKYANDSEKSQLAKEALLLAERVSLMIDGAFSWQDTSVKKHYQRCAGHQLLVWQGHGYKTILDLLLRNQSNPEEQLPIEDNLLFNKTVVEINWRNVSNGGVRILTEDGSTYIADQVIFTPSVGVLKQSPNLFVPPLPEEKLQAIESIGIAGVLKILLLFPNKWWNDDEIILTLLWNQDDLQRSSTDFPEGPVVGGVSWITAITLFAVVPGNPRVLGAWVTGDFVPEIERTSPETIRRGVEHVLDRFFGGTHNVTRPEEIIRSTWHINRHFRGTYSFDRAGFDTTLYHNHLGTPLIGDNEEPVVLFAGEATNPIHYSTVHGAIETGRREADRIINLATRK